MAFEEYTWIFALVTIAFGVSSLGNGANDIANSYSTTVAARSLTLMQVGVLAGITEFVGAVFLGSRVTNTLKSSIINISRFDTRPDVLMVVMMCAEMGSAAWLWFATSRGFSVSTTQTTVGAIVGAGIGAGVMPDFSWGKGSRITQTIVTWTIAPAVSGLVAAGIHSLVRLIITKKTRSLRWSINVMPILLAITATIMGMFIMFEQIHDRVESFAIQIALPVVLGSFFGVLILGCLFWLPFIRQRLLREDSRIRIRHILLGPYLFAKNPRLLWPGDASPELVPDYNQGLDSENEEPVSSDIPIKTTSTDLEAKDVTKSLQQSTSCQSDLTALDTTRQNSLAQATVSKPKVTPSPEERWLEPYKHLGWRNRNRIQNFIWYCLFQGVRREIVNLKQKPSVPTDAESNDSGIVKKNEQSKTDCIPQPSPAALAKRETDNRKEHLLTYAQVIAAMMMSIAHGSNDVSNAVGPWVTVWSIWNKYDPSIINVNEQNSYKSSTLVAQNTPIWILVAAALLMALGFWVRGWVIMSATGSKLVRQTPSRGFSVALGTAVTVLVASRIGMPVSTTQCVIGSCIGVGFFGGGGMKISRRRAGQEDMSLAEAEALEQWQISKNPFNRLRAKFARKFKVQVNKESVNWRQVLKLFTGWVLTLPVAGLISGVLAALLLRSPAL
jgi:solute carrier family 20 (sodium-dependent phosphate transporter)